MTNWLDPDEVKALRAEVVVAIRERHATYTHIFDWEADVSTLVLKAIAELPEPDGDIIVRERPISANEMCAELRRIWLVAREVVGHE